jgi:A/G-specific adenine glycosylase
MYLLIDPARRCLLEQRPTPGIWGGLWTPPERPPDSSPEAICAEFGLPGEAIVDVRYDPSFRHTFTHFHLDIEPVRVLVDRAPTAIADRPGTCWYSATEPKAIGLSAPAAKLLTSLSAGAEEPERP